jgi:hypothetical protein
MNLKVRLAKDTWTQVRPTTIPPMGRAGTPKFTSEYLYNNY